MFRCSRLVAALATTWAGLAAGPAFAAPVFTLGTHFGLEAVSDNGSTLTVFTTSPGAFFYLGHPGLRLGLASADGRFEGAADFELTFALSPGSSSTPTGIEVQGPDPLLKGAA